MQALFIITASASDDDPSPAAAQLARDGVDVFVIGNGAKFNQSQMNKVSWCLSQSLFTFLPFFIYIKPKIQKSLYQNNAPSKIVLEVVISKISCNSVL